MNTLNQLAKVVKESKNQKVKTKKAELMTWLVSQGFIEDPDKLDNNIWILPENQLISVHFEHNNKIAFYFGTEKKNYSWFHLEVNLAQEDIDYKKIEKEAERMILA